MNRFKAVQRTSQTNMEHLPQILGTLTFRGAFIGAFLGIQFAVARSRNEQLTVYLGDSRSNLLISAIAPVLFVAAPAVVTTLASIPPPVALCKLRRDIGFLFSPVELYYIIRFKFFKALPQIPVCPTEAQTYCYIKLKQVSRSFAAVILELHEELREAVCIFYLTLRGLDTIEDDMKPKVEDKIRELKAFYTHLEEPGWNIKGYGDKPDEIDLLEHFDRVIEVYQKLKPGYKKVIADITKQMGEGMAKYLQKKVESVADYEEYCHYVAGLVGYGLSRLFGESNLEDPKFKSEDMNKLSNSMGLFLQKTNIIRDYLEDITEVPPRIFWPKEIWSKYVDKVEDLKEWKNRSKAVKCLNHMVTDAAKHIIDCLDYLKMLKDPTVFKFCAIPQVMAIATLELCYDNYHVFRYEVKISKGKAVELILNSKDYKSVCRYFLNYSYRLLQKAPLNDINGAMLRLTLLQVIEKCKADLASK